MNIKPPSFKICIIGVGFMGLTHLKMYKLVKFPIRLTIVDKDIKKKKIAKKFGAEFYTNIDQAINENYFDIVDICLPTYLHYSVAIKILKRTKSHLLIEKPLTLNYREALILSKLAKKKRRICMCAHVERFFEPTKQIKEWCVKHKPPYQLIFLRKIKKPNKSWLKIPSKGGYLLLDVGIHDIDLLTWFLQSKVLKICVATTDNLSIEKTKDMTIDLYFANQSHATFYFGWNILQTSKISLINFIRISDKNGNVIIYDSIKNNITLNNKTKELNLPRYPNAYFDEIKDMINCILKKTKPKIDFKKASQSLRIIDLIKRKTI